MIADEMPAWGRNERREAAEQLDRLQKEDFAAVGQGALELIGETAVGERGQAILSQRRAGAVAA